MFRYVLPLLLLAGSLGCSSAPQPPPGTSRSKLEEWKGERIALPPSFAPDMALEGEEELLFAPGMFDASAADYFSYVFVLRYPSQESLDGETCRELLRLYYQGLMDTVARDKQDRPTPAPSTEVEIVHDSGDSQYLQVSTYDAFVTMKPLTLAMKVQVVKAGQGRCLRARVSPQPPDHPIWKELDRALASLDC